MLLWDLDKISGWVSVSQQKVPDMFLLNKVVLWIKWRKFPNTKEVIISFAKTDQTDQTGWSG